MKKYEYKVVNLAEGMEGEAMAAAFERLSSMIGDDDEDSGATTQLIEGLEKKLNILGDDSWKMVGVLEGGLAVLMRDKE